MWKRSEFYQHYLSRDNRKTMLEVEGETAWCVFRCVMLSQSSESSCTELQREAPSGSASQDGWLDSAALLARLLPKPPQQTQDSVLAGSPSDIAAELMSWAGTSYFTTIRFKNTGNIILSLLPWLQGALEQVQWRRLTCLLRCKRRSETCTRNSQYICNFMQFISFWL